MMRILGLVLAAGVALAGCSSGGHYRPAVGERGFGYSEQEIEENRFQVRFRGNSSTNREEVEIYLLFRAAELTLERGHDYFVVVERDTDKKTTYRSSYDFPFHHLRGHYFYYNYYDPFLYGGYDRNIEAYERYTAHADIVLYKGEKPEDNPSAYDAKSVIEHLRSQIDRAEP